MKKSETFITAYILAKRVQTPGAKHSGLTLNRISQKKKKKKKKNENENMYNNDI